MNPSLHQNVLRRTIIALACLAIFSSPQANASVETVHWLDMKGMDYDHQIVALALEGIVNRTGPRLTLDSRDIFWEWPPSDAHWREYYSDHGFSFTQLPDLDAAIALFRKDVKGVILYDPNLDASRYVACTLAGLTNSLPIPPTLRTGELAQLPVTENLVNRWKTDNDAYEWALKTLRPQCDPSMLFSAGRSHPGVNLGGDLSITLSLDYAIYRKAFCFNLSPAAGPASMYGSNIPGYPDQAKMFDTILDNYPHPVAVFGWAEPEPLFAHRVSKDGGYVVCAAAPNLSFHAAVGKAVPALANMGKPFKLPPAPKVKLKPITYVTFETNEGDTPKEASAWQGGAWVDPNRGKVPISWGFVASLAKDVPALYQAFASSATSDDGFFSGVSGGGYVYLDEIPDLDAYARETGEKLKLAGETVADVLEDSYHPHLLERYIRIAGLAGISHWPLDGHFGAEYLPDGTPVIFPDRSLFYYNPGDPAAFADHIHSIAANKPKPCFIELYGGVGVGAPTWYGKVAEALGTGFQAVRLDTMIELAKQAGEMSILNAQSPLLVSDSAELTLALRNPGSKRTLSDVTWTAPVGWALKPLTKLPRELAPRSTTTVVFRIDKSPEASPGSIIFRDNARHLTIVQPLHPASVVWSNNCNDPADWSPWINSAQAAIVSMVNEHVTISCPATQPYAAAELKLSLNMDRDPWLEINVAKTTGLWGLKVRLKGERKDIVLIGDTSATGVQRVNLAQVTGWKGRRDFRIIIFAIQPGKTVYPTYLRIYESPHSIP